MRKSTLARSAFPASPARFRGRFLCTCMTTMDPRQLWWYKERTGSPDACKTMHLLHALLFNRLKIRISILKGSEVMVWQLKFISVEIGRYENLSLLKIYFFVFIK